MERSQNLHNELLKICTTEYLKFNKCKNFNKIYWLFFIIDYNRIWKVKESQRQKQKRKYK